MKFLQNKEFTIYYLLALIEAILAVIGYSWSHTSKAVLGLTILTFGVIVVMGGLFMSLDKLMQYSQKRKIADWLEIAVITATGLAILSILFANLQFY